MPDRIFYEQPLTERVRNFLRLEHLFNIVDCRRQGQSEWDSRAALSCLLEIVDLLTRTDIKSETIKELERHAGTLAALRRNPAVDQPRLVILLSNIGRLLERLRDPVCQPGQAVRSDELVTAIKQRSAIPGGSCNFDLPAYHHWLSQPFERRATDLGNWLGDLLIIHEAITLLLSLIRDSATPTREQALAGFFQKTLDPNTACHLIRVALPRDSDFFPEISGGKHRFTVRFLEQPQTRERPTQTSSDVFFELHCCIL